MDIQQLPVISCNTVVVGSGAAALNAADRLVHYGQKDVVIVTEGMNMGTSRNTGSDKQTYYKLTLSGAEPDSVYDMAKTLFDGGAMDGDIALVEAALSAKAFYHLVDIGVPFPHNQFGEYVGYKTDHDPRQRATSAGPLTSKYMTEKLEHQVRQKGIRLFDRHQVIGILTDSHQSRTIGVIALALDADPAQTDPYVLFNATNVIYATGGPAGMYGTSVYPPSQTGATGIAFEAGVKGKNLTESQFGIASIKFRWNLSGTYQQVLPRYVSIAPDGSEPCEFLEDYFPDPGKMLDAIFLKGYQWPFDPRKVANYGSSLIDILVYYETVIKGRRVFLDFRHNPSWGSENGELDFSLLGEEAYTYLKNSQALFGRPIDRLAHMNQPAIDLYLNNGIDLSQEMLEIAVCAQHNNGGLEGNSWWESNLKHFFPVGEVNGSHGVYRPGGSALNSGQVGSTRAAQYIAARYRQEPMPRQEFLAEAKVQIEAKMELGRKFLAKLGPESNAAAIRRQIQERMTRSGAHIRSLEQASANAKAALSQLESLVDDTEIESPFELGLCFQNYDLLICQYVYLSAIKDYIERGGKSRGSYLVYDPEGELPLPQLPEQFRFSLTADPYFGQHIQRIQFQGSGCSFSWDPVKPIPRESGWFETVWNDYLADKIVR
ncbi:MAG TPA: FAD-binding protein [Firmicutes bacterium]|nr:FAD-binding protein [Bacillota bacterium]